MTIKPAHRPKLLAINFGGIGDEILFLPTLSSIRDEYPDWHITLLLEPRSKSITQVTDLPDATITFDIKKSPLLFGDLLDLLSLIRGGGYDLVLSSGSTPLVAVLLFLSGIPERIGYDSGWPWKHLLTAAVPLNQDQYAACMYHDLAAGLKVGHKAAWPQIKIGLDNRRHMQAFLQDLKLEPQKPILIHPGSSLMAARKGLVKSWPAGCWVELIRLLQKDGHPVILSGGPDDSSIIEEINSTLAATGGGAPVGNAFGITKSLSDLAALIESSRLFICLDSAPMHLAVALKKRLVALFGPTNPALLLPPDGRFSALKDTSAGQGKDTRRNSIDISVAAVYQAALSQLAAG